MDGGKCVREERRGGKLWRDVESKSYSIRPVY